MDFYKIDSPTTQQIFDAIVNNEYTPIEKIISKAKQVKVILMEYFHSKDIYVTFSNVTNCGGAPIFYTNDTSLYEVARDNHDDFDDMSSSEQDDIISLLGAYSRSYDEVFNLK